MLNSKDFNFSFSGLKTAVLYLVRDMTKNGKRELSDGEVSAIAFEAQEAITDGGVSANARLREKFKMEIKKLSGSPALLLPEKEFTTDNAVMIALAARQNWQYKKPEKTDYTAVKADANLKIA